MSRQNKVNPGMYTQRGRLTQDDAARELSKQRSIGSEHTWQPVQRDHGQALQSRPDDADDEDATTAAQEEPAEKQPARVTVKARPAQKVPTPKMKRSARTTARGRKTAASTSRTKVKSAKITKAKAKKSATRRKR